MADQQPPSDSAPEQVTSPAEDTGMLHRLRDLPRIVKGSLFALFFALVGFALQAYGLITVKSGHWFMFGALVVGVLIIWLEIIPGRPPKKKVLWTLLFVVAMFGADFLMARNAHDPESTE